MPTISKVIGDKRLWETSPDCIEYFKLNLIKIIDLREMRIVISPRFSTTLTGIKIGRMLQLFRVTEIEITRRVKSDIGERNTFNGKFNHLRPTVVLSPF